MGVFREKTWSPYVAGALAGLLLVLSVFLTGKYFGASTTFVRAAGFVEQAVAPEKVAGMEYFLKEKVKIDWQFLFVVGVLFGALASAWLSKENRAVAVPSMWEGRFGPSRVRRWVCGLSGGNGPDVRGATRRWVTERTRPERSGSGSRQRLRILDLLFPGRNDYGQDPVRRRERL